ncbi:MAG: hypothetical protein NTY88_13325 [Bacteroidetes bacterium]|nr:hypothetical protein [Bacteroidota bacterium]
MESILLTGFSTEDFFEKLRVIIREELKSQLNQDQLLTREGALKITGIGNTAFMRAIHEGIVKPQIVKGRTRAMYLESEVLKIEKYRKRKS